jgi:uncharacterized protein (TIGR03118 family)
VKDTPATTIFASLNGTISAWNSSMGTTAQVVPTPPGGVYTGLDIGSNTSGDFLYAANPRHGTIDVFNGSFAPTSLGPNAFQDPLLPAGLVPFNVDNINGVLYVTYAAAGPPAARNSAPEGVGAVAAFDTSGNFINQVTSGGKLASPWGITLAPSTFGQFGGDLLVGNFSYNAGEINAFDPVSGAYQGTLADENGNTLLAGSQGLWYLTFGNGGNGGLADTLYFTAGLNAETDGLFGAIVPTPENGNAPGSAATASLTNGDLSHSAFVGIQPIGLLGGNGLGSGAGSYQGVTPPAAMVWISAAAAPESRPAPAAVSAAQILATAAASPKQDAIDQLFATGVGWRHRGWSSGPNQDAIDQPFATLPSGEDTVWIV